MDDPIRAIPAPVIQEAGKLVERSVGLSRSYSGFGTVVVSELPYWDCPGNPYRVFITIMVTWSPWRCKCPSNLFRPTSALTGAGRYWCGSVPVRFLPWYYIRTGAPGLVRHPHRRCGRTGMVSASTRLGEEGTQKRYASSLLKSFRPFSARSGSLLGSRLLGKCPNPPFG